MEKVSGNIAVHQAACQRRTGKRATCGRCNDTTLFLIKDLPAHRKARHSSGDSKRHYAGMYISIYACLRKILQSHSNCDSNSTLSATRKAEAATLLAMRKAEAAKPNPLVGIFDHLNDHLKDLQSAKRPHQCAPDSVCYMLTEQLANHLQEAHGWEMPETKRQVDQEEVILQEGTVDKEGVPLQERTVDKEEVPLQEGTVDQEEVSLQEGTGTRPTFSGMLAMEMERIHEDQVENKDEDELEDNKKGKHRVNTPKSCRTQ